MDDDIAARINRLVAEEHELHGRAGDRSTDEDRTRLDELEVQLDQCWDLLRQRRARRDAGVDPADARVRPESMVEGYDQ